MATCRECIFYVSRYGACTCPCALGMTTITRNELAAELRDWRANFNSEEFFVRAPDAECDCGCGDDGEIILQRLMDRMKS